MRATKLSPAGTHWLKTVHLVLAGLWLGGAFAVVLGQYVLNASAGTIQVAALAFAVWLSVFKPWNRKNPGATA